MKRHFSKAARAASLLFALSACTSYISEPLPTAPDLALDIGGVTLASGNPDAGSQIRLLDRDGVALLALQNNPDLKAARLEAGLAKAQKFQTSLLPDPQFNGGLGIVIGGHADATAYTLGMSEDVRALILRPAEIDAADALLRQTQWSIAWQEWQTTSKAELLFIDTVEQDRLAAVLKRNRDLFAKRLAEDRAALQSGNATIVQTGVEAASFSDLTKQADDMEQQRVTRDHDLRTLLGLSPQAQLSLTMKVDVQPLSAAEIEQGLKTLSLRRPDLLALNAGYDAQEAKTRAAILGQFPAMVFGGSYARDTTDIDSVGPQVVMDIPIFNRNQGNVRIEQATREKLRAEYVARIDAAYSEAHAMMASIQVLERQLQATRTELPRLEEERTNGETAFGRGDLDVRSFSDIEAACVTRQAEAITLEQALLEDRLSLYILLGSPPPGMEPEL